MDTTTNKGISFGPESFVVAGFARGTRDHFARVLEKHGLLAFYALGTRRGTQGVSRQRTRLNPVFGLLSYAAAKCLAISNAESFRYRLIPLFDRWVRSQLRPGQHLITTLGLTNSAIEMVERAWGEDFH